MMHSQGCADGRVARHLGRLVGQAVRLHGGRASAVCQCGERAGGEGRGPSILVGEGGMDLYAGRLHHDLEGMDCPHLLVGSLLGVRRGMIMVDFSCSGLGSERLQNNCHYHMSSFSGVRNKKQVGLHSKRSLVLVGQAQGNKRSLPNACLPAPPVDSKVESSKYQKKQKQRRRRQQSVEAQ